MNKVALLSALLALLSTAAFAQDFSGGDGTEGSPYLISTVEDLRDLATKVNDPADNEAYADKHYKLTANLSLPTWGSGDINWTPIGKNEGPSYPSYPFKGTFDGNYKVISNLIIINTSSNYRGLFGHISGGTVKNIGLENVHINTSSGTVGGIAGEFYNSTITNCYVTGSIYGTSGVGGIAGTGRNSNISNCWSTAAVTGNAVVGGIVGDDLAIEISNSAALNLVIAHTNVGTGNYFGRMASDRNAQGTYSNNVAFADMLVLGSVVTGGTLTNKDGLDISVAQINADGTIGGRFTAANGWTVQNGKLPGFGAAIDMPRHLQPEYVDLDKARLLIILAINFKAAYITQAKAANANQARNETQALINSLGLGTGITATVTDAATTPFTAATAGTLTKPEGTNGSYNFKVTIAKDGREVEQEFAIVVAATPYNFFAGGNGTAESPFLIADTTQLRTLATRVNASATNAAYADKHYKLTANLNLSGYANWTPIGYYSTISSFPSYPFKGTFDGNGKVISNLKISDGAFKGLFNYIDGGTVKNIGLENVDISGAGYLGGIAGRLDGNSTISNCYVTGTVSGGSNGTYIGGIVGSGQQNNNGNISNCWSTATISSGGVGIVGGIAGLSSVKNSAALNPAIVSTGGGEVGGFLRVSWNSSNGTYSFSNNVAFAGMLVMGEIVTGGTLTDKNGEDITVAQILADGTIGGRFTAANGWTVQNGKLPAFGKTIDLPPHLSQANPIQKTIPSSGLSIALNGQNLRIAGALQATPLRIYNLRGNVVMSRTVAPNETVSVSHLPKGVYVVKAGGIVAKVVR